MNQVDDSSGPKYQPPWSFLPTDTNTGVGGKYIYIGYQLGHDNPVTAVDFRAYDTRQENPPAGWSWTGQDLKQGAGGKFIYMLWKKEPGKTPITALTLLVTKDSSPPPISGYQAIHQDLNQGAGGPYIWPYYSTTASMLDKEEALIAKQ